MTPETALYFTGEADSGKGLSVAGYEYFALRN